jgi:hypothetical protein
MGRTACTEPQCLYKSALYLTVELYLYFPYGLYGLYRASVPVQGCTLPYSRDIPLLPLCAVRPVQSLSACTRVHFTLPITLSLVTPKYLSQHPFLENSVPVFVDVAIFWWTLQNLTCRFDFWEPSFRTYCFRNWKYVWFPSDLITNPLRFATTSWKFLSTLQC